LCGIYSPTWCENTCLPTSPICMHTRSLIRTHTRTYTHTHTHTHTTHTHHRAPSETEMDFSPSPTKLTSTGSNAIIGELSVYVQGTARLEDVLKLATVPESSHLIGLLRSCDLALVHTWGRLGRVRCY